jgi:hypothetical protein
MPLKAVTDPALLSQLNGESDTVDYFARNSAYAKPAPQGGYLTSLDRQTETKFQDWVKQNDVPFDPSPRADYDMRGFYKALQAGDPRATTGVNANDGKMHFGDYWKTPYHKSFSNESQWATADAPHWNDKDQLISPKGAVVFDERATGRKPVTDPALLAQLNGEPPVSPPEGDSWLDAAKNVGSAFVRPIVKGAASLPLLAMDTGVAARNLTGYAMDKMQGKTPDNFYELPSAMFNRALDTYTRPPEGYGKGAEFVSSALAGSRAPPPQAAAQAPANFVTGEMARRAGQLGTLESSQKAGYVVPPSTTNPTAANKLLESLGGKIATAQDAALKNQEVTNTLAKRALGLSEDAPISKEALSAVRKEAGDAYANLRKVGDVSFDEGALQKLDAVASKFTGNKLKEALGGGTDIPKIVQAMKDEPLNGNTAVDAIDLLRSKATSAYASGDKEAGKAYKALAGSIEDLMERNLSGDALKAFRDARQLIAKTYSVEGALNQSTGNVVATKLASQLAKDKPLSGDLLTAARFGQAFPKAARETLDSGSVSHLDTALASGAAVMQKQPWWLAYPLLRQGVRSGLLSDAGQSLTVPRNAQIPPGLLMGGLSAEEQARYGLSGQE